MAKRGWKKSERDSLIICVKTAFANKIPLKNAFSEFAKKTNRKRDSVRNFYYLIVADANLRGEEIIGIKKNDIETFEKKELETLVRNIMNKLSHGNSLRASILSITKNQTKALRFQNKFRNLVKSKSPIIEKIMSEQKLKGQYYDPYRKLLVSLEVQAVHDNLADLSTFMVLQKDGQVDLLNSISEKIENLASKVNKSKASSIKQA